MSHEIDETTGKPAMAYVGKVPWHGLGFQLEAEATMDTWQEAAGLNWSAIGSPVKFVGIDGKEEEYPGRLVLHRSDTGAPLSVVTDRYNPVQPKQLLSFADEFVNKLDGFTMETAGALNGGRKIWILAKAKDDTLLLGKDDPVERYLLMATSFDFSIKTIIQQTSTRVVCNNTLRVAYLAGETAKSSRICVSHLSAFDGDAIKQQMELDEQWIGFSKILNKLTKVVVTDEVAKEYFLDVFYPESIRGTNAFSEAGSNQRVKELMDAYKDGPGQRLRTAKGTAWGLVNAVTYFVDHQVTSRDQDTRLNRAWFAQGSVRKTRAMNNATAFISS